MRQCSISDKSAISGLKLQSPKIQRPHSDNYTPVAPSSSRSSPIMSVMATRNSKSKSNLGSTSNLSTIRSASNLRSSIRSNASQDRNEGQTNNNSNNRPRPSGLSSRYSLSKSNLNHTSSLNRSNLNLNNHLNTLPSLIKPTSINSSNLSANLSGSINQLSDTSTGRRSLVRPKNSPTFLPAPSKSRPTSVILPESLTSKSKSKLPNNASKTSSNLNLNDHTSTSNLVKPKDNFNLKSLNKKPATSHSIKSTMQNLSQSTLNTTIYKPYSTLNNRPKPKLNAKDAKINLSDLDNCQMQIDKKGESCEKNKNYLKKPNSHCLSSDKCNNVARVSPIRRPYTMSNNVKRHGSLNSTDQEEYELDDDLFDNSTINQQTSEDTNSFNSEDAKFYAVLSSSDEDKLSHGPRSRAREERRLRRASGQRSSSSKRSSPTSARNAIPESLRKKTSTPAASTYQSKQDSSSLNLHNDDSTIISAPTPNAKQSNSRQASLTNLNKSNSSSINTIDHKSTSLNTMFPTLNRLHNSTSIQRLNSTMNDGSNKSVVSYHQRAANEQQGYQSDDAETTLYKLKSLDFNTSTSTTYVKESHKNSSQADEMDSNNNSLTYNRTLLSSDQKQTNQSISDDCTQTNEYTSFTTPGLNSLLNNYMSRSIGSLTGSLNGLNGGLNPQQLNNNWCNQKTCSTPPLLPNSMQSRSPTYQSIVNSTAPSSFQPHHYSFLLSPTDAHQSANGTVINNVHNTTALNNIPPSFTTRINKTENRGSSLSLLSGCSSNYSNNLSITRNPQTSSTQSPLENRLTLDKSTLLNEIKHLKNELNRANVKINQLNTKLVTSDQIVHSFEQSLQTRSSRMKQYSEQIEEKDHQIERLNTIIEHLKKSYGITSLDLKCGSNASSPTRTGHHDSSNLHNSRSLANHSSDSESVVLRTSSKSKVKKGKKRSDSKKSRANSVNAHSTDDDDTISVTSMPCNKDGTLNGSTSGWFKSSITRAFKKKNNRSKNGSNQELDKTLIDLTNDIRHPHHPSQLHQSYIHQDKFKDCELMELKAQLDEKEKCLTDERLKSLSREDEIMKLKDCLANLQQELFNLKSLNAK